MCGIVGAWTSGSPSGPALIADVERGAGALVHRGPDAAGAWASDDGCTAFGFRRLAILDLSPAGDQPMRSSDGRWTMVFNGEIYNHATLRRALDGQGHRFGGHSDSEVLLAAVQRWGVDATLEQADGMFALGLWDETRRELILARDRFGEKPLYWWSDGAGRTAFASEVGALRALGLPVELDPDRVAGYLMYGYSVDPSASMFTGIHKVPPGAAVRFTRPGEAGCTDRYWSLDSLLNRGEPQPSIDALVAGLRDAVRSRMDSDRPIGALLSGGLDSTIVTALMAEVLPRPVETFTVGFAERAVDESHQARAVAAHLGCQHHELLMTPDEVLGAVPQLSRAFDEPFADPSALPMMLVSRLAAQHVTVVLSGDGADELFGGYERYRISTRAWNIARRIPEPFRRRGVSASTSRLTARAAANAPLPWLQAKAARAARAVDLLAAESAPDASRRLMRHWPDPELMVPGSVAPVTPFDARRIGVPDAAEMMRADTETYLPGDILTKLDRATMAVSIEARAPFLDPKVAMLAWRIDAATRIDGRGKEALWSVVERLVPLDLVDRPKQGFALPLREWLRGPLRGWADDLLAPEEVRSQGVLDADRVASGWAAVRSGTADSPYGVWSLLMLQSWLAEVGESSGSDPWNKGGRR